MNEQDRMSVAKQMSQKEKNMVMIGAAQVNNNTLNENALMPGTIKQQQQSNVTSTKIRAGSFI